MLQRPGYQYNLFNRASCPETLEETTKIDPNLFLVRFTPVSTLYALLSSTPLLGFQSCFNGMVSSILLTTATTTFSRFNFQCLDYSAKA